MSLATVLYESRRADFWNTATKPARLGRIMPLAIDLLHPDPEIERQRHKLKRLVQHPNSYFMDVKCPGCFKDFDPVKVPMSSQRQIANAAQITTVFSHATTVVVCVGCNTVLCTPTGGKARLTEGCSFRKKQH
ncbi:Ribosomal protein S27 [Necator americanus]|uniref:Ribosomal protein S27 n=1 Tax=Necator americanus TaxID=51031 RepID=W2SMJ1_NECAM|nr:Ribosomal protein S27 [Necator americanus]ETN70086.1 Ribosomal protein S27 [Necator americanus]